MHNLLSVLCFKGTFEQFKNVFMVFNHRSISTWLEVMNSSFFWVP